MREYGSGGVGWTAALKIDSIDGVRRPRIHWRDRHLRWLLDCPQLTASMAPTRGLLSRSQTYLAFYANCLALTSWYYPRKGFLSPSVANLAEARVQTTPVATAGHTEAVRK